MHDVCLSFNVRTYCCCCKAVVELPLFLAAVCFHGGSSSSADFFLLKQASVKYLVGIPQFSSNDGIHARFVQDSYSTAFEYVLCRCSIPLQSTSLKLKAKHIQCLHSFRFTLRRVRSRGWLRLYLHLHVKASSCLGTYVRQNVPLVCLNFFWSLFRLNCLCCVNNPDLPLGIHLRFVVATTTSTSCCISPSISVEHRLIRNNRDVMPVRLWLQAQV